MKVFTVGADATREVARALARVLRAGDVVVLAGEMGAGKTTFVQGLAAGLGVAEAVRSPTFALVHAHDGSPPLVHVDVYRLERVQELHDLGLEELLDGEGVVVVEWGERVGHALPADRLVVRLEPGAGADDRWITLASHGSGWRTRWRQLEGALAPFLSGDAG